MKQFYFQFDLTALQVGQERKFLEIYCLAQHLDSTEYKLKSLNIV